MVFDLVVCPCSGVLPGWLFSKLADRSGAGSWFLRTLDVSGNPGLGGSLNDATGFCGLQGQGPIAIKSGLQSVFLNGTALTGTLPDCFHLYDLTHFSVARNQITGPMPPTMETLDSLQLLDISYNQIT